ncbi:ABC transporter permease [Metabacillus litoralis]|uniref:ABC transporter permease n=1 Tax=Metabacillus litoralis TaxID=152268 RepID=UPI001CFD484A|nr:ABC transporter permease [Metabacillus litoralis]
MLTVFQADLLKIKRKWFWFLVFLGPFGVIAMQMVNYGVRYDYLVENSTNVWQDLIANVNMFVCPALLLGMTILASQIATIEHQQSSWKQLLSLPIKRRVVFSSKFFVTLMMLFLSSLLLFIGTILLGLGLGFDSGMPLADILKNSFYPLLAGLPILALQVWLSVSLENQAISLTVGIFGAVFSVFAYYAPDWVIWKWPLLYGSHEPIWYVTAGTIVGIIILFVGMIDFEKRDVK